MKAHTYHINISNDIVSLKKKKSKIHKPVGLAWLGLARLGLASLGLAWLHLAWQNNRLEADKKLSQAKPISQVSSPLWPSLDMVTRNENYF